MAIYFENEKHEIICPMCRGKLFTEQLVSAYMNVPLPTGDIIRRMPAHVELQCVACGSKKQVDIKMPIVD